MSKNNIENLKILHIITRLDLGGSAENTLLTAIGFAQMGYKIDIICGYSNNPPSLNEKKAESLGIKIIRIRYLVRKPSPLYDIIVLFYLIFVILKNKYKLVHTHTSKAGILGRIAAKIANVKYIIHTPHGHIFYGYFPSLITNFFIFLERFCSFFTSATITLTNKEKEDYVFYKIEKPQKIFPIYSGIELEPFLSIKNNRSEIRKQLGISNCDFVAGTVARLVAIKNHKMIIGATKYLKDEIKKNIKFVFVGDGELYNELVFLTKQIGMENNFIFTGWRNDIANLLSAFDIFIMCSKNEGMGRAFIEAMACGIPVIGTKVGGVPEIIVEGKTGYLVPLNNEPELAEKIDLLYNQIKAGHNFYKDCRNWVIPRFGVKCMIEEISKVYQFVIEGKR